MREGWQPAHEGYVPTGAYSGLQFPIRRLDRSWLVIDECRGADGRWQINLHFDGDDMSHEFLPPEAWAGFPNKKRLANAYNAPHRRSARLRINRMTILSSDLIAMLNAEILASEALRHA